MAVSGGCLCGKVRYEIAADAPIAARHCWCRVCQYLSAGSGMANVVYPKNAVTVTGEMTVFTLVADSGAVMRRSFCPACGTPLFSEADQRPQAIVVRVGSLDDRERGRPESIIWTKSAPTWACFDPALPQSEGQAPPPK